MLAMPLTGWIMEDDKDLTVTAKNDIPMGHKLALKDYKVGDTVPVGDVLVVLEERIGLRKSKPVMLAAAAIFVKLSERTQLSDPHGC